MSQTQQKSRLSDRAQIVDQVLVEQNLHKARLLIAQDCLHLSDEVLMTMIEQLFPSCRDKKLLLYSLRVKSKYCLFLAQ